MWCPFLCCVCVHRINAAKEKLRKAQEEADAKLKAREQALKGKYDADKARMLKQKEDDVSALRKQVWPPRSVW